MLPIFGHKSSSDKMQKGTPTLEQLAAMAKAICEKNGHNHIVELLTFSTFTVERHWDPSIVEEAAYELTMHVDPDVYIKNVALLDSVRKVLRHTFDEISPLQFGTVLIYPNYDQFALVNGDIQPVYTAWEQINRGQQRLIELLRKSSQSIDFQNIGNTARTLLQLLSDIVFDPAKHVPSKPGVDVSPGKFKNRLYAYLETELKGPDNAALRQFGQAQITAMEKTIDLANETTHKLDADWPFAEACVVGAISTISVLKVVHGKSK